MTDSVKIIPVMVNKDGSMSVCMLRRNEKWMSFVDTPYALSADRPGVSVLQNLPAGLLSEKESAGVAVRKLKNRREDTYVVIGDEETFAPPTSFDSDNARWVAQKSFRFGPLPEGSPDVAELRSVWTGSMTTNDREALVLGLQEVRTMREIGFPAVIGTSKAPAADVISNPEAFSRAVTGENVDRTLSPINLAGVNFFTHYHQKGISRRKAFMLAAKFVTLVQKVGQISPSLARDIQKNAGELARTGEVPKPA